MASKNFVELIGNLAQDPKAITVEDRQDGCALRVATDYQTKDGKKLVEFHSVVAWNGQAKTCLNYLKKGRLVLIEGRLHNRVITTKSGDKVTVSETIATRVQFLDRPKTEQPAAE